MADGHIKIDTRLNNDNIKGDLEELKALVEDGATDVNDAFARKVETLTQQYQRLEAQQAKNNAKVKEYADALQEADNIQSKIVSLGKERTGLQTSLEQSKVQMQEGSLSVADFNTKLSESQVRAKEITNEIKELEKTAKKIDVDKLQSGLGQAQARVEQTNTSMDVLNNRAKRLKTEINASSSSTLRLDRNFKSVGKSVLRYAVALFSIRSIYAGIRRAMQAWMSATEEGAQAQADLAYMWQSIGNAVAPVFLYLLNIMKTLLGYVNAITQALFGFSIFTKASAKNMGGVAKTAKEARKQLAGFDEMNVLQGGSSGGGSASSGPVAMGFETPDLSGFEGALTKIQPLIEAIKNSLSFLYNNLWKPMYDLLKETGSYILDVFVGGLSQIAEYMGLNQEKVEGALIVFGFLITALAMIKIALMAITALSALTPFGWIVIAIAAIIFAIGLWKKYQQEIMDFTGWVIKGIVDLFKWLWDVMKTVFNAPVAIVRAVMTTVLDIFRSIFNSIVTSVRTHINSVIGVIKGIVTFISGVFKGDWKKAWQGVVDVFRSIMNGIANIFKTPFNIIIDGINSFVRSINKIKIPSWVPVVGGKGFNVPTIPRLAKGGIISSATTAVVGEGRHAEAVLPIDKNEPGIQKIADALLSNMGGGQQVTIVQQMDGKEIARYTYDIQKEDTFRTNGRIIYGT